MNLYEIQQKANEYIRSIELLPTIRERIFLAINDICGATPDGKDWSFLKTSFTIERDSVSTDTRLVFKAPSNLRSLIEVVSLGGISFDNLIDNPYNYYIEWNGREIIIERTSDDEAFPSGNLVVLAYQTHPPILVVDQQHQNPTWATDWSASYPPASAVLLPDEAADLVFDATMLRLRDFETEVYFSIEKAEARVQQGLKNLLTNYALQIYPLNPPSTPSVEWLVAVGNNVVGGEKYQNQILGFVNELAGDFADIAKVPLSGRPSLVQKITKAALPTIDGLSVPAEYWSAGMVFKVASFLGNLNQPQVDKWEKAKAEWQSNYLTTTFAQNAPSPATINWLLDVGMNIAGGKRYESQILEYINEIAGELADEVKTQITNRPNPITSASNASLPTIGGVSVPPLYWASGMVYRASVLAGKANQAQLDLWERSKKEWHSNFNENVFEVNPPSTPSVEWLVKVGNNAVGGDRYQSRILAFVNELAGEFADVAKVPLVNRPAIITTISSAALPAINGINIPAEYWANGMRVKCGIITGTTTPQDERQWEITKQEWASNYYVIYVQQNNFSLSTFGGLIKYIQTEWKSCRDDHQAWTLANEVVADVMSRVNTDSLIASKTYNLVEGQKDYALPTDLKTIIKVEIDGREIVGRSFTARGGVIPNMTEYQYLHYPTQQAFRMVGANISLDVAPSNTGTLTIWYYKNWTWTTTSSASVPVDPLLVIKAVQARVAVEERDFSKATYCQNEFEKAIVQYNNNQYRNYPADDRVINATPSVNRRILAAYD